MKPRLLACLRLALLLSAIAAVLQAAIVAGNAVYTKKFETALLSDPQPLAKPTTKIALGRKLKVDEVRGVWLRVSDGSAAGWVFTGNVSDTKPVEIKGADGLPLAASETTVTAAGRPLTPEAVEYANRLNLSHARDDVAWLLEECRNITPEDVDDYLQKHKKGEYQ